MSKSVAHVSQKKTLNNDQWSTWVMGTYPSALAQKQQVADTTFCPDDDRNVTKIAMLMSPSADRFNVSCPRAQACVVYSCLVCVATGY